VAERRRVPVLWIAGTAFAVFLVLTFVILTIALVSALRERVTPEVVETPGFAAVNVEPEPTEAALIEPTATPEPTSTATPEPQTDFVQVGNTGGTGAFIRREPRAGAPGIVAHRDGTVLRVVGPDELVAGRSWRHVEDRNGNRGWTPREYLLPTQQRF
jgi:Na+-transporting methylmalonyl-CoA/oxaloacetate decarboxylase gamma subunit